MSQSPRPSREAETELIPTQDDERVPRTLELPVVPTEDQGAGSIPQAHQTTSRRPPAAAPPPAASEPTSGPPSAEEVARADRPSPAGRRPVRRILLALALAAVVAVTAVAWTAVSGNRAPSPTAGRAVAPVTLPADAVSFDPSGGSGFARRGTSWRTQTYKSAQFGNLKPGVGLLLDLGTARHVAAVDLTIVGGPITVELRAADKRASTVSGYAQVAQARQATGSISLRGDGRHRYWLVWVSELGPQAGGFGAELRKVQVRG
jgi:hypothetical protein